MAHAGAIGGLLKGTHAEGCTGTEYNRCEPLAVENSVAVVLMVWCGACNAADYRLVKAPNGQ